MTGKQTRPAGRHALDAEPAVEEAVEEAPPACNVAPCVRTPEWRGLCSAHRQTHRGLADAKQGA